MDLEFVPLKSVMNLYNTKQKNTEHNLRKGNIRENEFIALNYQANPDQNQII